MKLGVRFLLTVVVFLAFVHMANLTLLTFGMLGFLIVVPATVVMLVLGMSMREEDTDESRL